MILKRATIGVIFAFFMSCSDDPSVLNSVGNQFITSKTQVKTDTLRATGSSTFRQYSVMNGRTNLFGQFGGYNAYSLLQFFALPQRDTVVVLSATLALRAETWFGDSASTVRFNVHEINRSWDQSTFRWDSMGTDFFNSGLTYGGLDTTITADTQMVQVSIDPAMVTRWLQSATSANNFGVALVPRPGANVIRGIHSFDVEGDSTWPSLTIIARGTSSTTPDTMTFKFGQDTFVGNIDNLNTNPELIYSQSGVVYRSSVVFDCSTIPRGAIINKAQLVLSPNLSATRITKFTTDTAIVAHVLLDASDNSKFEAAGFRGPGSLTSSGKFTADVRHYIQKSASNQSLNYGLIIRATSESEFNSFDVFAFYNHAAQDSTQRPYVVVTYTVETN